MNEFQHEVKEALTSMMRQGKKSPSIWASSQPTIEMKWKSKPVKGCMSNASIVFYEFGMLESKSACRPRSQHSTCSTEICVEIIRLFIHKCYVPQLFFSFAPLFFLFSCWLLPQHTILLSLRHCQHPCLPFMSYQQKPNEGKKRSIIINWCLMSHPENLLHSV